MCELLSVELASDRPGEAPPGVALGSMKRPRLKNVTSAMNDGKVVGR
jgi:hypothetical protein